MGRFGTFGSQPSGKAHWSCPRCCDPGRWREASVTKDAPRFITKDDGARGLERSPAAGHRQRRRAPAQPVQGARERQVSRCVPGHGKPTRVARRRPPTTTLGGATPSRCRVHGVVPPARTARSQLRPARRVTPLADVSEPRHPFLQPARRTAPRAHRHARKSAAGRTVRSVLGRPGRAGRSPRVGRRWRGGARLPRRPPCCHGA